tara:strand:+ start:246 stop:707 length:462 start_codon:yes stop_codon:yes gene_type:complete
MLKLDDKQYWGDSQYIDAWWGNGYAVWENLRDLEDRCFSKWLYSVLQTHGILDSNSKWYMSRDIELEAAIGTDMFCEMYDLPPLKDDDSVWDKLAMQEDNMVYATCFSCSSTNPTLTSGHSIKYYKNKNLEVIDFFFDCYPNSGIGVYFVRTI